MSFQEVANEIIREYLPANITPKQLAAFQTHYSSTIVEQLKAKHDGSNTIRKAFTDKLFKEDIPKAFETFIEDNQLVDNNQIRAPTTGNKNTLIQRTILPDEDTGRESMEQSIRDSVKADLFAYRQTDMGVGMNNDMMLDNVRAFNDIRMQGDLFCPKIPEDIAEPIMEGTFLQTLNDNNGVLAQLRRKATTAFDAVKLIQSDNFQNHSHQDFKNKLLCPFNLPRRDTPFVPINSLEPYQFSRDISMNGMPIDYMNKQIYHRDNSSMREPLMPDQLKGLDTKNQKDASIYNFIY
jgi:hypothetical protein